MNKPLAPIALFVFNRVDHLSKTIEALQKNELADESELFIFSDAPRKDSDWPGVTQVRQYLKTISGFKNVHIIEQTDNRGLAESIIFGVTKLTNEYGRAIILEDDIVTSKFFLRFMNDALDFYENQPKVMHISGYNFPMPLDDQPETFFIVPATCWGWATWKRAWLHFDHNTDAIIQKFSRTMKRDFNLNHANDYFLQLIQNQTGILKTWAIYWHATVYLNNGLSLHSAHSMCLNIGHDGTGEHCSVSNIFDVQLSAKAITEFETKIEESASFRAKVEHFFRSSRPSILIRIKNKLRKFGFI